MGVHARASGKTARLETRETRAEAREENSFFRVYVSRLQSGSW